MPEKNKSIPHPDDFMVIAVALGFQAKLNPDADDPQSFELLSVGRTLKAADATEYLETVLRAIRDRRLCGLMVQENLESCVGIADWIAMTIDDLMTETRKERAERGSSNNQNGENQSD